MAYAWAVRDGDVAAGPNTRTCNRIGLAGLEGVAVKRKFNLN